MNIRYAVIPLCSLFVACEPVNTRKALLSDADSACVSATWHREWNRIAQLIEEKHVTCSREFVSPGIFTGIKYIVVKTSITAEPGLSLPFDESGVTEYICTKLQAIGLSVRTGVQIDAVVTVQINLEVGNDLIAPYFERGISANGKIYCSIPCITKVGVLTTLSTVQKSLDVGETSGTYCWKELRAQLDNWVKQFALLYYKQNTKSG